MADNFQTEAVSSPGATFASDEIGGTHHERVKMQTGADGTATDVSTAAPLPTDFVFESPQSSYATSASVAAGSSVDLDSAQVSVGTTAKLLKLWIGASVPVKVELKTVTDGVASATLATLFRMPGDSHEVELPSRQFVTVAYSATAGLDGFRVTMTNLDTGSGSSDMHCTFFWDEA